MNDTEYDNRVDAIFLQIEEALDALDETELDIDYESAEGILTLIFTNGSKIIMNKQPPLHQIWVATKYNGHHFNLEGEQWIDERSGAEFWQFIDEATSKQAETPVKLSQA
ncbi:iron donor protein CyaY [Alteromonas oceanisediminis]|uniref:iron donor protein CyaY n=1 Tax=Alteromonas oceanisediminis TaxID=2836180 RepID=UPI001BDA8367|nr:iron donor protein CyaY [Alteromonas oceanisediminis]MBT0586800.1 iron donor protein CyaY [Alteromonas oceanisediminis]